MVKKQVKLEDITSNPDEAPEAGDEQFTGGIPGLDPIEAIKCHHCFRYGKSCNNTDGMSINAIEGDLECFYQLARQGGGPRGLHHTMAQIEGKRKAQRQEESLRAQQATSEAPPGSSA